MPKKWPIYEHVKKAKVKKTPCITHHLALKIGVKFVSYNHKLIITVIIITEFDCIQKKFFLICSSIFGLLFGLAVVAIQNFQLFEDSSKSNNSYHIKATVVSILSLIGYVIFACLCTSKYFCNELHSYILFFPVRLTLNNWSLK